MVVDKMPISTPRMIVGLVVGSLAGLVSYIFFAVSSALVTDFLIRGSSELEWRDLQIVEQVLLYFMFGAPIAMFMGLLVGLPLWRMAEQKVARSIKSALLYGSITGGCIGLIFLIFELATGLDTFLDDSSSYETWSYGYQITRDGLPTALGWLMQLKSLVFFSTAGAVGGFMARAVAIPASDGNPPKV